MEGEMIAFVLLHVLLCSISGIVSDNKDTVKTVEVTDDGGFLLTFNIEIAYAPDTCTNWRAILDFKRFSRELTEPVILAVCNKNPNNLIVCPNLEDSLTWQYPANFWFDVVTTNFSGFYSLDVDCDGTVKQYVVQLIVKELTSTTQNATIPQSDSHLTSQYALQSTEDSSIEVTSRPQNDSSTGTGNHERESLWTTPAYVLVVCILSGVVGALITTIICGLIYISSLKRRIRHSRMSLNEAPSEPRTTSGTYTSVNDCSFNENFPHRNREYLSLYTDDSQMEESFQSSGRSHRNHPVGHVDQSGLNANGGQTSKRKSNHLCKDDKDKIKRTQCSDPIPHNRHINKPHSYVNVGKGHTKEDIDQLGNKDADSLEKDACDEQIDIEYQINDIPSGVLGSSLEEPHSQDNIELILETPQIAFVRRSKVTVI